MACGFEGTKLEETHAWATKTYSETKFGWPKASLIVVCRCMALSPQSPSSVVDVFLEFQRISPTSDLTSRGRF